MLYRVCLEEMEGRWVAHVPTLPGCFSSNDRREAAIAATVPAIHDYMEWVRLRARAGSAAAEDVQVEFEEVVRAWNSERDYEVNAFFAADRPALAREEIDRTLLLLDWARADLLAAVEGLTPADLSREVEGNWSIHTILLHAGVAEWWYLDRLGLAFPRPELPVDPFERLNKVRGHFRAVLPELAGDDRVVERNLELWSPRKMLRRALWHERDHTAHVWQFRGRLA